MPLSTFLNGRTPTTLRGLLFLSLSDSAIIQKRTATSDSGGGASWVWASTGTVSCRVYPAGGAGPSIVGGALDEATTHFCRLPLGASVDTPDRVVVSGRGTFEVTLASVRTDEASRLVEVMQVS
jgi:hypothetical protein